MGKILNNPKECVLAFVMGALVILGIIGGAGSLNWAVKGEKGWLFIVAGIVGIIDAIYAGYSFYKHFLKPTE